MCLLNKLSIMTDFQQIAVKHFEKDVCFFKFTQKLCVLVMGPVEGVKGR